jgi:hypothetical protein
MTFLQQLQAHKGGLLHLKTQLYWYDGRQLYWYDGRGYDNNPGRVCLILDATAAAAADAAAATTAATAAVTTAAAAHLLIDGRPAWIWVAEQDIELLVNDQPIS